MLYIGVAAVSLVVLVALGCFFLVIGLNARTSIALERWLRRWLRHRAALRDKQVAQGELDDQLTSWGFNTQMSCHDRWVNTRR